MNIKILHFASFKGNIGDSLSHQGFYTILKDSGIKAQITELEIRDFYKSNKKKRLIDESIVKIINDHDLLIIGGGGFLDYWVNDSQTGTSIDISTTLYDKIKVPIIFNSIGSIPHKEVSNENIKKYSKFLSKILNDKKTKLFLRNDGSANSLRRDFNVNLPTYLDNGFYYKSNDIDSKTQDNDYVIINVNYDQLKMNNLIVPSISLESFVDEICNLINWFVANTDKNIMFTPHIYKDFEVIHDVLNKLDDNVARYRIRVSEYAQGNNHIDYFYSIYKNASFIFAMRLHANILGMTSNGNLIGICGLDRIYHLHKSVNSESFVMLENNFSNNMIEKYKNFSMPNYTFNDKIKIDSETLIQTIKELF